MSSKLQQLLAAKKAAMAGSTVAPVSIPVPTQPAVEPVVVTQLEPAAIPTPVQDHVIVVEQNQEPVDPRIANLRMQLADLESALKQNIPSFPTILRDIHLKLRADPAVVTLMSDAEINLVVQGLQRHTQIEVVAPAAVKGAKKALPKKGTAISAEML